MFIAFLFALFITTYSSFAYESYLYEGANFLIGRINLFPLISWTAGLVLLKEIYRKTKIKHRIIIISFIYLFLLLSFEYIGYYKLGIRMDWKIENNSLFGLGIIHGSSITHIFYLTAGPIYLMVTDYLKVK